MTAFRMTGVRGGIVDELINPGDLVLGGESISAGALTTVGAGTLLGALIASGIIYRTGPTGAYTDTTDTAANILAAISGNAALGGNVVPGSTFRLLFVNTVAFAMTLAAGTGVTLGTGTTATAASLWREYLLTVLNASAVAYANAGTVSGTKVITFEDTNNLATTFSMGPNSTRLITPGMIVSGTGIAANTKVLGITLGVGGIAGVVTDTNSTATGNAILTFSPSIQIDGLRSGTI